MFLYFAEKSEPLETIRSTVMWDVPAGQLPLMACETGPTGKAGHILAGPGQHRVHGYSKTEQEWVNCGDYWLGWDKKGLPTPEQLQRKKVVAGEVAALADGREWVCPTVRRYQDTQHQVCVPSVVQCFGGKYQSKVRPEYLDVWQLSGEAWDQFFAKQITVADLFRFSVQFLAVNYRIGQSEASALELFDGDAMTKVLSVALGIDDLIDAQNDLKKNEQDGR